MKRKQKRMNKLFNIVGQVVMYIIFNVTYSTILFYGIMTATTL
jgi:hypothetical protein